MEELYNELLKTDFNLYVIGPIILFVFYIIYYKKFNYYIYRNKIDLSDPKLTRKRGHAPPSFPNGYKNK